MSPSGFTCGLRDHSPVIIHRKHIPESSSSLTRRTSVRISAQATSWPPPLWFADFLNSSGILSRRAFAFA